MKKKLMTLVVSAMTAAMVFGTNLGEERSGRFQEMIRRTAYHEAGQLTRFYQNR